MRFIQGVNQLMTTQGTVVTLGNFDGFHRGHQLLVQETCSLAHEKKLMSVIFTFDPHPREVLLGSTPLFRLSSLEELKQQIQKTTPIDIFL